jgi:hypothetical protein
VEYPGRRPFYKYASPKSALAILRNRTIRYSSPLEFNDPFDQQVGLHFDFDLTAFPDRLIDKYEFLAEHSEIQLSDAQDSVGRLIALIREKYPTHGFPRDMFDSLIKPTLSEAIAEMNRTRHNFEKHWLDSLRATRTFCVAEDKDNLLMWSHYAKDHKGVVLELWSLPEEDNALSVARKVTYAKEPPSFFTQDEFLDDFCGIKRLDHKELTRRIIHTKSDHWSYENEWRVYYPLSEKPGLYEDLNIRPSEFTAIYFGCRSGSDQQFMTDAQALLAENFPTVRKYKASKSVGRFALGFSEI